MEKETGESPVLKLANLLSSNGYSVLACGLSSNVDVKEGYPVKFPGAAITVQVLLPCKPSPNEDKARQDLGKLQRENAKRETELKKKVSV
ncbi:MAG: hypothetical protein AAF975_05365 [Spirochaetota bacterium]